MIFNDTITIYTHNIDSQGKETWIKTIVDGVQWSDSYEKKNEGGKISLARFAKITFPEGKYEGITLDATREEDAIFYGSLSEEVTTTKGSRLSDLLNKYQKSGRIKAVNDNSNRSRLKNKKVVIA